MGTFDIEIPADLKPLQDIKVRVVTKEGGPVEFMTTCRIDTPVEIEYYRNGGILHTVLRNILKGK
jgi:aconitate hydratase